MPDQLAFWGVAVDLRITRINYGDVIQRSSEDQKLRIKNESTEYNAIGVELTAVDATTDAGRQYLFSSDGEEFVHTLDLGDMAASSISPIIYIRRVTPSDFATGACRANFIVSADTWAPAHTT